MSFLNLFSSVSKEINNITPEYLQQKRNTLSSEEYSHWLKQTNEKIKSTIINSATKGKPRNNEIENNLRLVQDEIKKIIIS